MASQALTHSSVSLVQPRAGSSVGRSSAAPIARSAACPGHRAAHLGSSSALRTTSLKAWQPTQRAQSRKTTVVKASDEEEMAAALANPEKPNLAETFKKVGPDLLGYAKWFETGLPETDNSDTVKQGAYRPKKSYDSVDDDDEPAGSDGYWENLIQIRRVTKVAKGGKNMSFRAVVAIGDKNGTVGVGVGKAKEVIGAVEKARIAAQKNCIKIELKGGEASTFQHKLTQKYGGALVMLRPACDGTGVIAGGACKTVLELAGVKNGFAKQYGSSNQLNNAMATLTGLQAMRSLKDVAKERGMQVTDFYEPAKEVAV